MSSQKGNTARNRPQKHQNAFAFKNTLHDTNHRTKAINNTRIERVCIRCKEVIEWKIKYKKYKPLTKASTCVRCNLKTVKQAYHVMCAECAKKHKCCAKCCKSHAEISCAANTKPEDIEITGEMKSILKGLSERKRRTFNRFMERKNGELSEDTPKDDVLQEIMEKLKSLDVENDCDLFDSDDDDDDDGSDIE